MDAIILALPFYIFRSGMRTFSSDLLIKWSLLYVIKKKSGPLLSPGSDRAAQDSTVITSSSKFDVSWDNVFGSCGLHATGLITEGI